MAITITITDGTNTVTLSGTDAYCDTYQPVTPEPGDESLVETLEVKFFGGLATVDANLVELERLFDQARRRQDQSNGITAVYFKLTLDSDVWRSEIYDGKIVSKPEFIKYEWATGERKASVIVERAPYWEDDTERQISLTNGNGTDNTAGLNIYNVDDGSGSSPNKLQNYAEITAAKVLGDLPAPVRLVGVMGGGDLKELMVWNNVYSDPANLVVFYQGENGGAGDVADGGSSGGKYRTQTGTDLIFDWDLTSMVAKLQGQYFRILSRLKVPSGTSLFKFSPYSTDLVSVWNGPTGSATITTDWRWYDLGIIAAPPQYVPGLAYGALRLGFEAKSAASATLHADCWYLAPLDGWRKTTLSYSIGVNESIVIDEGLDLAYSLSAIGPVLRFGNKSGSPLCVYPNHLQRLQFCWNPEAGAATDIVSPMAVKLYYRPRRRAV